jgi:ethanolamine ammonia-lyase small subunit
VHAALDFSALTTTLRAGGIDSVTVHSQAPDRQTYLLRPDLGRQLLEADRERLVPHPGTMAFVVCDGLSATAVARHAATVLARAVPALQRQGLSVAPVVLASQGRVALGDAIGEALQAEAVAVLIGERPGLSAADSLGIYLTWQPRRGRTDAERNCISNVRPAGLPPDEAADKLLWLIAEMRRLRLTGIGLKDEQGAAVLEPTQESLP